MSAPHHMKQNILAAFNHFNNNEVTIDGFFEDLFTPNELMVLDERLNVIRLLLEGKTQREVAQELSISVTTVSRGAKILEHGQLKEGWRKI